MANGIRLGRIAGIEVVADWGEIMTPAAELACVSPRQDAAEALALLARRDVNQLPVLDGDKLVGLLRREDLLKWLSLHETLERDRLGAR
jgi:CBS domain-containing protein